MIVRGFVEAIVDDTHVKVRVPKVNKMEGAVGATPTAELAIGVVCTPPGYSPRLRRGDAVIIGYENDDESSAFHSAQKKKNDSHKYTVYPY